MKTPYDRERLNYLVKKIEVMGNEMESLVHQIDIILNDSKAEILNDHEFTGTFEELKAFLAKLTKQGGGDDR